MIKRTAALVLAVALSAPLARAQSGETRIPIAIPDFTALSKDVKQAEVEAIQELLANAIANEPIFKVLERAKITEIFNEVAFQIMTPGAMDTGISQKLMGARALLIGNVGRLYGRTVITTRLVDLESGLVLFANNIYANDDEIAAAIDTLANAIRDKGLEMTLTVTEDDVAKQVKAKNFSEAKRLADSFLRAHPDSASMRALYPSIIAGLADDYYRRAQGQLKRRLFDDARSLVNQALALKVDPRFYALRERIESDEDEWNFKQAMAEARRAEELERRAAGVSTGWDGLESWLADMTVEGAYVGAVYAPPVDAASLYPDFASGAFGGELSWYAALGKEADGKAMLNWISYLGLAGVYVPGASGATLKGSAYLSPLLAQSAKVGNLVLCMGFDAGAVFEYSGDRAQALSYGATGGGLLSLSVRAWKRFGVFAACKVDYAYYPDEPDRSGPSMRLSSGLSF